MSQPCVHFSKIAVKLLKIWALWHWAWWSNRDEHLRPSNYIGWIFTLIVLGKFEYLSPDYLRVAFRVFGRAFLYKLKWTVLRTIGRNEHQISLADRAPGKWGASYLQISSKSVNSLRGYRDFSIFEMAAAAILDYRNSQILFAEGFWRSTQRTSFIILCLIVRKLLCSQLDKQTDRRR